MTTAQTSAEGCSGRRLRQRLAWCRPLLGLLVFCRSAWRQFGAGSPLVRGVRAWCRFRREGRAFRSMPFADRSIPSLSSICVIEHIGLGRYGDDLDPDGSEKAAAELRRVLAAGGDLYVSVPIDDECRVYFNAHRAFTRSCVLELFADLELVAEQYLYGHEVVPEYAAARGFGTGMFHFRKP